MEVATNSTMEVGVSACFLICIGSRVVLVSTSVSTLWPELMTLS
uniref:Uncharacterized protein n=1 Tax=Peronospora matthiolae TaxID=2874970 RepID=A0AAV1UK16_9STRA